jgi:folate-binding protein YgfZ
MRFRAGVIEETSSPEGRNLLPLEVGHHIFQAINFKKGCFIGQEVNMRLFHRGSIKRTLKGAFSLSPMDEPIPVGTVISLPPPFKARVVKSLLNQKKQWAGLIFIEGQQHHTQSFFSLSYNDTILSLSPPNPPQENTHG